MMHRADDLVFGGAEIHGAARALAGGHELRLGAGTGIGENGADMLEDDAAGGGGLGVLPGDEAPYVAEDGLGRSKLEGRFSRSGVSFGELHRGFS